MGERPTIAIRVDETQKERWQSHVEGTDEYDSLSHLIRVAVSHEISDEYGAQTGSTGGTSEGTGEVLTAIRQILSRLDDIEDEFTATKKELRESKDPQITDLTLSIMETLPAGKENAESVEEIADKMDENPSTVAGLIINELGPEIAKKTDDGKFYKEI